MTPTKLLTRTGEYVVTVNVPPFTPPVEAIQWGNRMFIRQPDGEYREGLVWAALGPVQVFGRPGEVLGDEGKPTDGS